MDAGLGRGLLGGGLPPSRALVEARLPGGLPGERAMVALNPQEGQQVALPSQSDVQQRVHMAATVTVLDAQRNVVFAGKAEESRTLIEAALSSGALSQRRDREIHQELRQVAANSLGQLLRSGHQMEEAILTYQRQATGICEQFNRFTSSLLQKAIEGSLEDGGLVHVNALAQTLNLCLATSKSVANDTLDLCDRASRTMNDGFKNNVLQIFEIRRQELDIYAKELQIIENHELHEVEIACTVFKTSLEAQQTLFGQMKEMMELEENQKQAEAENELKMREMELGHAAEMEKVEAKKRKAELQKEAANFAARLKADVDRHKAQSEAQTAMHKASVEANARIQIEQMHKDVRMKELSKSCTIM